MYFPDSAAVHCSVARQRLTGTHQYNISYQINSSKTHVHPFLKLEGCTWRWPCIHFKVRTSWRRCNLFLWSKGYGGTWWTSLRDMMDIPKSSPFFLEESKHSGVFMLVHCFPWCFVFLFMLFLVVFHGDESGILHIYTDWGDDLFWDKGIERKQNGY